jgi:hypothetical protein
MANVTPLPAPSGASILPGYVVANTGTASGIPGGVSLSALFDAALGATPGAISYRGSAGWVELAPGSAGQVLTQGTMTPGWGAAPITGVAIENAGTLVGSVGTLNLGANMAASVAGGVATLSAASSAAAAMLVPMAATPTNVFNGIPVYLSQSVYPVNDGCCYKLTATLKALTSNDNLWVGFFDATTGLGVFCGNGGGNAEWGTGSSSGVSTGNPFGASYVGLSPGSWETFNFAATFTLTAGDVGMTYLVADRFAPVQDYIGGFGANGVSFFVSAKGPAEIGNVYVQKLN